MANKFAITGAAVLLSLCAAGPTFGQSSTGKGTTGQAGASGTMKMTQTECESLWNRADSSNGGSLPEARAQSYTTNFSAVDTDSDGKLSRAEFLAGCDKGTIHSTAGTGGAAGTGGGAAGGSTKK